MSESDVEIRKVFTQGEQMGDEALPNVSWVIDCWRSHHILRQKLMDDYLGTQEDIKSLLERDESLGERFVELNDQMGWIQENLSKVDEELRQIGCSAKKILQSKIMQRMLNSSDREELQEIRSIKEASSWNYREFSDCLLEINALWKQIHYPGKLRFEVHGLWGGIPNNTICIVPTAGRKVMPVSEISSSFQSAVRSILRKHVLFGDITYADRSQSYDLLES